MPNRKKSKANINKTKLKKEKCLYGGSSNVKMSRPPPPRRPSPSPPPEPAPAPAPAPAANHLPLPEAAPAPEPVAVKRRARGCGGADVKKIKISEPGEGRSNKTNSKLKKKQCKEEAEKEIPEIITDIKNNCTYQRLQFYGRGGFGICYKIKEIATETYWATKIISKKMLTNASNKKRLTQEINIHRSLKHKHVVAFHSSFEDINFLYMLMEVCKGRSLQELQLRRRKITVPECRYFTRQILLGLAYLHGRQIIHRDLKPGNIFLDQDIQIKIGDFGLATRFTYTKDRKQKFCGTPNYMAPEILTSHGHSYKADIWSIGCLMYTLLVGSPPFDAPTVKDTYSKIKCCDYSMPSTIDQEAASMIAVQLQLSPRRRPTAEKLLQHEFVNSLVIPDSLPQSCLYTAPRTDQPIQTQPVLTTGSLSDDTTQAEPQVEPPPNKYQFSTIRSHLASLLRENFRKVKSHFANMPAIKSNLSERDDTTQTVSQVEPPPIIKYNFNVIHNNLISLLGEDFNKLQCHFGNIPAIRCRAIRPSLWVIKWAVYPLGFGYLLSDDTIGIVFKDSTKIFIIANDGVSHFITEYGTEYLMTVTKYTVTEDIDKNMRFLFDLKSRIMRYLKNNDYGLLTESDEESDLRYLYEAYKTTEAAVMYFSNGALQLNFDNETKVIICPLFKTMTYIEYDGTFSLYPFKTIEEFGCPDELYWDLRYSLEQLNALATKLG
ncbi:serine/threonine-protein kinase polo-like [Spodoptera litura]|uniref:polo kinase n=1 Tax=Spodoptera litura TaxID=69820 RepID=A0A9J7ERV4_SPOLT|nr:serine/threonine-protein kinase polo-like [Spodoptera litura]